MNVTWYCCKGPRIGEWIITEQKEKIMKERFSNYCSPGSRSALNN
jgi:hypothetical protein